MEAETKETDAGDAMKQFRFLFKHDSIGVSHDPNNNKYVPHSGYFGKGNKTPDGLFTLEFATRYNWFTKSIHKRMEHAREGTIIKIACLGGIANEHNLYVQCVDGKILNAVNDVMAMEKELTALNSRIKKVAGDLIEKRDALRKALREKKANT